jgi:transcriptional regulator with XRE-family HTH domain
MTRKEFNLRRERERLGMTQEEFARKNLVTRQTIINWESGVTNPDEKDILWMKKKLKISFDNVK